MQRNLQVVVNKFNVVVVSAVVILVVLLTVVSSVRVIGGIGEVSTGVAIEQAKTIEAVPDARYIKEIAGVVVVNPNGVRVPVHVNPGVVQAATSRIAIGRVDEPSDFAGAQVPVVGPVGVDHMGIAGRTIAASDINVTSDDINGRAQIGDRIAIAALGRDEAADIGAGISGIGAGISGIDAGYIAEIVGAPIADHYIGANETSSIARIDIGAAREIAGGKIVNIAGITGRSGGGDEIG